MLKLSIIIPCYNCEQTLREAVESCYQQGFATDEFEIVMVNDGSTDNTYTLMENLANEYKNIRIFQYEKNQGGGATRNTAVAKTKSEIIFCLDSDDILPKNTLNQMYFMLIEKKCDGIGLHKSTKFIGTNINDIDHVDEFSFVGKPIPFTSLLQKNGELCPLYSVFMFTKPAFNRTGGYPTDHGFDTQGFAWRFLSQGLTAYTCPNTNYLHRINFHESYYLKEYNQGRTNFNWQKILLEHAHLLEPEVVQFLRSFPCQDFTRDIISELNKQENIFITNFQEKLGQPRQNVDLLTTEVVLRHSLLGLWYRVKARLRKL